MLQIYVHMYTNLHVCDLNLTSLYNTLQHSATSRSTLATQCQVQHHSKKLRNTALQHTTTHCNTLQQVATYPQLQEHTQHPDVWRAALLGDTSPCPTLTSNCTYIVMFLYVCMYVYIYTYNCIYTHLCVYIYIRIDLQTYRYINLYIGMYIYIYVYTHM